MCCVIKIYFRIVYHCLIYAHKHNWQKLNVICCTFQKFENYILKIILINAIEISTLKRLVLYFQKIVSNIRVSTVL